LLALAGVHRNLGEADRRQFYCMKPFGEELRGFDRIRASVRIRLKAFLSW
jgi:hypothetical protein